MRVDCPSDDHFKTFLTICALFVAGGVSAEQNTTDKELQSLIQKVLAAARASDYDALSLLMADEFRYSFGGSSRKEEAIKWYQSHPNLLLTLETVLSQSCALTDVYGLTHYVCPAAALNFDNPYYEHRAAFRHEESGEWSFVWFIAGD